jgi:hypothetical protein
VVSFTTRPLYPCGKSPRYTVDRKLGGRGGEDKNPIAVPRGNRTSAVLPAALFQFLIPFHSELKTRTAHITLEGEGEAYGFNV